METNTARAGSFDLILALLGILVASALVAYTLLKGLSQLYLLVGLLLAISCSYWVLFRKRSREWDLLDKSEGTKRTRLILAVAFFLLLLLSILSLYFRPMLYERPVEYFVLTSTMAGVVALESLMSRGRWNAMVLVQAMTIGLSLAWSQLLIFPGLMQSDPWYHQLFTNLAISENAIPSNFSYAQIPLFHLLVGSTSILFDVTYRTAMVLSVSLAQVVIITLFIFLIGTSLTGNSKVGLLAALILAISDHEILMSATVIPVSLAAAFVPIVIFLLLKVKEIKGLAILIAAFLMVAIVLTHTITSVWLVVAMTAGAFFALVLRVQDRLKRVVSLTLSAFFATIMFGWWTYASGDILTLSELIKWGFNKDYIEPTRMLIDIPVSEQILIAAGMYLLFSLSLIGAFYLLARKDMAFKREIAVIFATPLIIGFVSMVSGLFINQQRWFFYAQITMAIPMAITVYLLFGLPSHHKMRMAAMSGFVVILSFLMIMGGIACTDNRLLSPTTGVNGGMTTAELTAVRTTNMMWPHPAVDAGYTDAFLSVSGYEFTILDDNFLERDFSGLNNYIVLIRTNIEGNTFSVRGGLYRLDYNLEPLLYDQNFSKIYDNGAVRGYRPL